GDRARRADHGSGSALAQRDVGGDPRSGGRGHHDAADHPVLRGGRSARRRHRGDRPRQVDRTRDGRGAQRPVRRRPDRARRGRPGRSARRAPGARAGRGHGHRVGGRPARPVGARARTGGHAHRDAAPTRRRTDRRRRHRTAPADPGRRVPGPDRPHRRGRRRARPGRRLPRRPAGRGRAKGRPPMTRPGDSAQIPTFVPDPDAPIGPLRVLSDSWVIAKRNLSKSERVPGILVFILISPIMFVLLFAYVFGGAIDPGGGVDYREFLIGGIFAQTVVFGSTFTGAGLAEDMQKGVMDRFRSLPMARSAVLIGRTVSDIAYNLASIVIMALTGLLVGWRIRSSVLDALAGFVLLLVFAYAFSWVMAWVGLLV